jgi:ABC-2 type transport system ATP-binding protein
VLMQGNPLQSLETLKGQIWSKRVERGEATAYKERLNVISDKLIAGKPTLHVYAPQQPEEGFEQIVPDLEDVYFSYIFGRPQEVSTL